MKKLKEKLIELWGIIYAYLLAHDKVFHFVIGGVAAFLGFLYSQLVLGLAGIPCYGVSLVFGLSFAVFLGIQKEVLDKIQGRKFDKLDLLATCAGGVLMTWFLSLGG